MDFLREHQLNIMLFLSGKHVKISSEPSASPSTPRRR